MFRLAPTTTSSGRPRSRAADAFSIRDAIVPVHDSACRRISAAQRADLDPHDEREDGNTPTRRSKTIT